MHVGLTHWLHAIDRYERSVRGYHPPSISPTRRQLIAAGLPFCSLQATTQHLQPMHLPMSKWNRYCSPGPGTRRGMRADGADNGTACVATEVRRIGVNMKVTPSSVARFNNGSDISTGLSA